MEKAINLARRGFMNTWPNPLVGAVIVKKGKIIGQGYHRKCGLPHAEPEALRSCRKDPAGSTLYVNLEPCCHYGRTPPCVNRIAEAGIKRVVMGCLDPNPRVGGKGAAFLRSKGIKVRVGCLEQESRSLNEVYFKYMKKGLPFVVCKIAQSVDGKIATSAGQSKWITSPSTRKYFKNQRRFFQAILVGVNTVLKDNPSLSSLSRPYPVKVILDTHLKLKKSLKIFRTPGEVLIFTSARNKNLRKTVSFKKARLFFVKEKEGVLDIREVLKILVKENILLVLAEGGSAVSGSLFDKRLVDRVMVSFAPKILGGKEALASISGKGFASPSECAHLKNVRLREMDQDYILEADVSYGSDRRRRTA